MKNVKCRENLIDGCGLPDSILMRGGVSAGYTCGKWYRPLAFRIPEADKLPEVKPLTGLAAVLTAHRIMVHWHKEDRYA